MSIRTIVTGAALAPLLISGSAFAEITTSGSNQLGVVSTPVTSSVSSGNGVALGTIALTSPGGSYTVNSVPVNLNVAGGALASNLSNCSIFNQSASSTQALGSSFSPTSGQNSFSLSSPLTINSGTPVTLQIRCDVGSSTPSGSIFQFTAGSNLGSSNNGSSLAAQVDFVKQLPAGLSKAIIAIITLDATRSSQPITVTSIPIAVTASGGANLSALSNCYVSNMSGTSLTSGGNMISAITGDNKFTLDAPLNIPAGQGVLLAVRCDVSPTLSSGSTLTFSFAPSAFTATSNGSPVLVTQGFVSTGVTGTNSGSVSVSPVGSTPDTVGTPAVPGTPNTGMGGDAAINIAILVLTAAIAFFAARRAMQA